MRRMQRIKTEEMEQKCLGCGNALVLETKTWDNIDGGVVTVLCPTCKVKGEGSTDITLALSKFDRALTRSEYQKARKPEKILTDIRDYLVTEKGRVVNSDIYLLQIQAVEKFADKALADLTEYAKKLGVEL
jgi:hypothetical protein